MTKAATEIKCFALIADRDAKEEYSGAFRKLKYANIPKVVVRTARPRQSNSLVIEKTRDTLNVGTMRLGECRTLFVPSLALERLTYIC
jgi:hypothetical protein